MVVRKATMLALGVPVHSSTQELLNMGTHNTVDKIIKAHFSNQRIRMSQTEPGRTVLRKVEWSIEPQPNSVTLPLEWRDVVKTNLLSRNM